ncbi:glycosyltransferase family 39 protein [bacterium]|nr:glycosyltransferase family 39 protein [bacterium]
MNIKRGEHAVGRIIALLCLGLIVIFGAWIRFDSLETNALYYDECVWADLARNWSESGLVMRSLPYQQIFYEHPPLSWLLMKASMTAFGQNKFGLRFPSLTMSILLIVLCYILVRELNRSHDRNGYIGAWFFLIGSISD